MGAVGFQETMEVIQWGIRALGIGCVVFGGISLASAIPDKNSGEITKGVSFLLAGAVIWTLAETVLPLIWK